MVFSENSCPFDNSSTTVLVQKILRLKENCRVYNSNQFFFFRTVNLRNFTVRVQQTVCGFTYIGFTQRVSKQISFHHKII